MDDSVGKESGKEDSRKVRRGKIFTCTPQSTEHWSFSQPLTVRARTRAAVVAILCSPLMEGPATTRACSVEVLYFHLCPYTSL